jgi:hypothetical protein
LISPPRTSVLHLRVGHVKGGRITTNIKKVAFLSSLEENGKKKGQRGQGHEWGNRRNGVSASVAIKPFKTSWQGNDIELLKDVPIVLLSEKPASFK